MLNLNLPGPGVGALMLAALIAAGCAHTDPAPAPAGVEVAEQPAEPRLTAVEEEALAIAEWEAWKTRHSWEERLELMGLEEDPGPDPDPAGEWVRFGRRYSLHKFPKATAVFHDTPLGWVRPLRGVFFGAEIYRDDAENVWVWIETSEQEDPVDRRDAAKYPVRNLNQEDRRAYI